MMSIYIYIFEYSASFIMIDSREPYSILCVSGVGILVKKLPIAYSVIGQRVLTHLSYP